MDHRPKNRGPSGPTTPKRAHPAAQNASICNRTGCSGRIKNVQIPRIGCSDKPKCANPSSRSSIGNEITRKALKSSSIMTTSAAKPCLDSKRNLTSQTKSDPSESSPTGYDNPSASSSVRPKKITHLNKSRLNDRNSPPARSVPSASRSAASGPPSSTMMRRRSLERESGSSSRERKTTYRSPMSRPMATSLPDFQNRRNSSSVVISESPTAELPPSVVRRSSSMSFSSSGSASFASGGNGESSYDTMDFASDEHGFMHLMGDDMLRGYNLGGVIEMLLALERIEQDQELTHEDLLALETSLFLGSLSLYDRHRDMRLDIDNMSYEELLALEEKMGNVTTALSEDAVSKCLKKGIYEGVPQEVDKEGDDIKCSICQEEYADGDEIGSLVECQHGYHLMCINQWLQLKNWCPICKASAGPSQVS